MAYDVPKEWPEMPLVFEGADIYIAAGQAILPLARYLGCRIYIVGGQLEHVACSQNQYFECLIMAYSKYTAPNPAPPRDGFVGNRGGQVVALRPVKDGES